MKQRPSIAEATAKSVHQDAARRGVIAFVPYWFILCIFVGGLVAELLPTTFFANEKWDVSTAVYAGMLSFNALLMSLGWLSFSKIQEILLSKNLGEILRKHDLLGIHLAFIDLTHLFLIVSCCLSGAGLVAIPASLPLVADQILFGAAVGFTIYALIRAYSATGMANALLWEQAHLDGAAGEPPQLRALEGGNGKS